MAIPRKLPHPPGYFNGLYTLIANAMGCSTRYVSEVLRGKYDDRDTQLVKEIKASYQTYVKAVKKIKQPAESR